MASKSSVAAFFFLFTILLVSFSSAHRPHSYVPQLHEPALIEQVVLQDRISTPCDGAICTLEYYDTAYSTCTSSGSTQLPAYTNCCILSSCQPDASGCTLHLDDGTTVQCPF